MLALSWLGERELDLIQPDSSSPGEATAQGYMGLGKVAMPMSPCVRAEAGRGQAVSSSLPADPSDKSQTCFK